MPVGTILQFFSRLLAAYVRFTRSISIRGTGGSIWALVDKKGESAMFGSKLRKQSVSFPSIDRRPRQVQDLVKDLTEALRDAGAPIATADDQTTGRVVYVVLVPIREPEYSTHGFYM
jgi:hypothetical protein